ncbi:MAG: response regulator transcription factor [Verrucomicrobia bacterium]|nr:response regulator transcription factor [Verrucomicrobiota bacterium]
MEGDTEGMTLKIALLTDDGALKRTLVGRASVRRMAVGLSGCSTMEMALLDGQFDGADFILIDTDLAGDSTHECIQRLRARGVRSKVILLAQPRDLEHVFRAFQAGADGCFPKDESPQTLRKFLRDFRQGGAPIPPRVVQWIVSYFQKNGKKNDPMALLTRRENEILEWLAKGCPDKQIARHLTIALTTVNDHLKSIYRKLGVHSRAEAVAKYLSRVDDMGPRTVPVHGSSDKRSGSN